MDTIGRYSVLEDQSGTFLGHREGARIGWHKAFNHDLRCYAALAVIAKELFANEESRQEFTREVGIAASIHHRSVASVFPLELIEESYIYAMEFCEGETVADRTKRIGYIEALDALNIASQITAALESAVAVGLLHRNIAAENILLQDDGGISVKLLGLALPARNALKDSSIAPSEFDFRSPEEIDGKSIDVRSGIYSIGALLCFMEAGLERYAQFRERALRGEKEDFFGKEESFSVRISRVVAETMCRDPQKRIQTFAGLQAAIEEARTAPEQFNIQEVSTFSSKDDAPEVRILPEVDDTPVLEVAEPPVDEAADKPVAPREGELMIPPELMGVAQPGTVLRLTRVEEKSRERVVVRVGDSFRIGRSDELDLVTRFLPRNKANDKKTMRLSKRQITIRCEGNQILLLDGSGGKPSTNGCVFDGQQLSAQTPIALGKAGELKLADVYSVQIIPLLEDTGQLAIANLGEWSGSVSESTDTAMGGAVLFVPIEPFDRGLTIWLFSTATFGVSDVSTLDFGSGPKIGVFHYFCGCFWIEQRSIESLLVDDLPLGLAEIAPLATGQIVNVMGNKYRVEVQAAGKQQKP